MSELEQHLVELDKSLKESQASYSTAFESFEKALDSYEKAVRARDKILQDTLKEKGLAVCSGFHHYTLEPSSDEWKVKSPEELGIFPRDQMKLRYLQGMMSSTEHFTMVTSEYPVREVLLLCPTCFSKNYINVYGTDEVPKMSSEVIQKDEKFVLAVNGADITALVNKRSSSLYSKVRVEPNGEPYPDLAVYRYLGILDLPERPSFDRIR